MTDSDKKLTDEQREEIQRHLDQPLMKFDTREGLYDDAAEGKRLVRILLSSEQAWKEEAADTDRALLETLDRVHDLEGDINKVKFQLKQAIEVLRCLDAYMDFSIRIPNGESIVSFKDATGINEVFERAHDILSSLKEVSP
jgi:hypothetical protein